MLPNWRLWIPDGFGVGPFQLSLRLIDAQLAMALPCKFNRVFVVFRPRNQCLAIPNWWQSGLLKHLIKSVKVVLQLLRCQNSLWSRHLCRPFKGSDLHAGFKASGQFRLMAPGFPFDNAKDNEAQ